MADSALEAGIGIIHDPTYNLAAILPFGLFRNECATSKNDSLGNPVGDGYTSPYIEGAANITCDVDPNGGSGSDVIGAIGAIVDASHLTSNEARENSVLEPREIVRPVRKDINNEGASTNHHDDGGGDDINEILKAAKDDEGDQDFDEDKEVPEGTATATSTFVSSRV
jgi:hypothetical protein